jgi:hypothetical protein
MLSQAGAAGLQGLDLLIGLADDQSSPGEPLQQMWQTLPFNLLYPGIREEVVRFAGNPKVFVLGHEIDTSAFARLTTTPRDDYGRFAFVAPAWRSSALQAALLRQVDVLTENA